MTKKSILLLIKRISIAFAGFVLLIIIATFVLLYFFQDRLIRLAIDEINQNLNTKIEVEQIDLTLWKKFPQASLQFKNVRCDEVTEQPEKKKLLKAESVFLSFDIWDFFTGNYTFKRIDIVNANAYLRINKKGTTNFDILKKQQQKTKNVKSGQTFQFNKVMLKNVLVDFENEKLQHVVQVTVQQLDLKGKFSEKRHTSRLRGKFFIDRLVLHDETYMQHRHVELNMGFDNNTETKQITIDKGKISIENLNVEASGIIRTDSTGYVDLNLVGKKLNIQSFISLLPGEWRKFENEYQSEGEFFLKSWIRGNTSHGNVPDMEINFGVRQGAVTYKPTQTQMKNLNLTGRFVSVKNGREWGMYINDFDGILKKSKLSGKFSYEMLNHPVMKFSAKGSADLAEIYAFMPIPGILSMQGLIELDVAFEGSSHNAREFTFNDYQRSLLNGTANLNNVTVQMKNQRHPFRGMNGTLEFNRSDATIRNLSGNVGSSDLTLNGSVKNLPAYLFVSDAPLQIDADARSSSVLLHEWLSNEEKEKPVGQPVHEFRLKLPERVNVSLNMQIDKLEFNKFSAENIQGIFTFRNRSLQAESVTMHAFGGLVKLSGIANGKEESFIRVNVEASLQGIQLNRLFYECGNFGQKTITHENLNGNVDAFIIMSMHFTDALKAELPSVLVNSQLTIQNGELIRLKSLDALSKFIRVEELRHVKFATLTNQIRIENETVIIPEMQINSSAINLVLSGTHTFKNQIDYRFNVLLKDLLAQKFKKNRKQQEFGEIIEEEGTGARLYLKMTGTADDPIVAFDTKGVREKIKQDLKEEKKDLKQMLYEEFGWFKKDTTIRKENLLPPKQRNNKNKINNSDDFEFE
ncbi:MAG: AsmA-like C-terminal region-containing protein [Flavobacteriales bacterium]|nr:AsmA-like C-terminal region-containing protein [Flavobacteriales bacterium]